MPVVLSFKFFLQLITLVIRCKFSLYRIRKNYLSLVFKFLKTKKVLSFYENTNRIKLLKNDYPNIDFFTFINGTRTPNYKYKHDNFVSWGKIDYEMDTQNKPFKSNKYHYLGSLRLLNYKRLYNILPKKKIDIIYVSAYSFINQKLNKNIYSIYKFIKLNELEILKSLSSIKKLKNIKIKILMKSKLSDKDFNKEYLYFKKFFPCSDILIKKNDFDSYKFIEKSKITISLVSALGLEAISLNTKVLLGFSILKIKKQMQFWSSLKYYSKYLAPSISLQNTNKLHLIKKINILSKINNKEYLKITKKSKDYYSIRPDIKKFKDILYDN